MKDTDEDRASSMAYDGDANAKQKDGLDSSSPQGSTVLGKPFTPTAWVVDLLWLERREHKIITAFHHMLLNISK